jgi:hypothetical protein
MAYNPYFSACFSVGTVFFSRTKSGNTRTRPKGYSIILAQAWAPSLPPMLMAELPIPLASSSLSATAPATPTEQSESGVRRQVWLESGNRNTEGPNSRRPKCTSGHHAQPFPWWRSPISHQRGKHCCSPARPVSATAPHAQPGRDACTEDSWIWTLCLVGVFVKLMSYIKVLSIAIF